MKLTKTMLVAALALGALLASGSSLFAQDTTTPPANGSPGGGMRGRGGPSIEMLTTNLSLTTEQVPQVKTVLGEQRQKMTELRGDTSLSSEDRRTKMQAIRADTMAKMKVILTPEQFAKFEKMGPGMRGNRPPGGAPGSGGAGGPPSNN